MPPAHPQINEIQDGKIICAHCEEWRVPDQFALAPRMKRGRHTWCKACMSEYAKQWGATRTEQQAELRRARRRTYQPQWAREWRAKNPGKQIRYTMWSCWGITPEQFEEMMLEQEGKCANTGCDSPATDLDHDHSCCPGRRTCGECIRGILCHRCNIRLGRLETEVAYVSGLLSYLYKTSLRDVHTA